MLLERKQRGDEQRRLRIGHALERQPHAAPHGAARAVGADDIAGAQLFALAAGFDLDPDVAAGLLRLFHLACEADFGMGRLLELVEQRLRQLPLLALQAIGMTRLALQHRQVEHRAIAGGMQADLPMRAGDAARQHHAGDAERLQHVERRRMKGRGPQIAHDCVLGLDNRHGNLLLRQQQGDAEPDRPAAGDDHLGVGACDRCRL